MTLEEENLHLKDRMRYALEDLQTLLEIVDKNNNSQNKDIYFLKDEIISRVNNIIKTLKNNLL
jgi:hypothetical protein